MNAETAYVMAHGRGFTSREPGSDPSRVLRGTDRQLCALGAAQVLERLETRVATTTNQLSALKRRVSTLAASRRTELNADIQRLDALKLALRSNLDELGKRGDKVNQIALHQAENLWNELSDALQRVTATMQR